MKLFDESTGFSLIEILIASAIITIVSLGAANLAVGVMRGNSFNKRLTTATTLMKDRLEEVKRLGYSNAGGVSGTQDYGTIPNFSGYKRIVSIKNSTPGANMKTVEVVVYWDTDKRSVKASTILSE